MPGHTAQAGSAGLSQLISSLQPQSFFFYFFEGSLQGSAFLQSHSSNVLSHLLHLGAGSHGQAGPVTTGSASAQGAGVGCAQGQAAIAEVKEHVAIPTAIAAATVSFLIVIFTSLCYRFLH